MATLKTIIKVDTPEDIKALAVKITQLKDTANRMDTMLSTITYMHQQGIAHLASMTQLSQDICFVEQLAASMQTRLNRLSSRPVDDWYKEKSTPEFIDHADGETEA